jgi:hypothetical protein
MLITVDYEIETMSTNPGRIQSDPGDRNMTRLISKAGASVGCERAASPPLSALAIIATIQFAADCWVSCTRAASHSPMDTAFDGLALWPPLVTRPIIRRVCGRGMSGSG